MLLALLGFAGLVPPTLSARGAAAAAMTDPAPVPLALTVGGGTLLRFAAPVSTVFLASPEIADVQAPSPHTLFVLGRKTGRTALFALGAGERVLAQYQLTVQQDVTGLAAHLGALLPRAQLSVQAAEGGVILGGVAPDPATADQARAFARQALGDKETIIDQMAIAAAVLGNLRVRVAEVSRSVSKDLGFNWESLSVAGSAVGGLLTGRPLLLDPANPTDPTAPAPASSTLFRRAPAFAGGLPGTAILGYRSTRTNLNLLIDALAAEGLVTILAEPNLTALSGQGAQFLAGGEFPIPIPQGFNQITIEFKRYGVALDFLPTVLASDRISLKVRPEVSELTDAGAITVDSIRVPGLAVRRAETTVELGSGESFAIGGLIQNNTTTDVAKYPGLGDLPILGALFRSSSFQRSESELVIIVTPYLVRPAAGPDRLALPTDGLAAATDRARILAGAVGRAAPAGGDDPARLLEGAGFVIE